MNAIYVWVNEVDGDEHEAFAMSQDGVRLAHCVEPSVVAVKQAMGVDDSRSKHGRYARHYPGGFYVHFVEAPREHEGLMEAFRMYQSRAGAENPLKAKSAGT